jgi:hypothetical protein
MQNGLNGLNSIDSLFGNGGMDPLSSFSNPLTSSLGFGSVINQAMAQAKTPADKAKVAWAEAKFSNQMALSSMFENPSSPSSLMGMSMDLSGASNHPFGLPSWAYDLERLLGPNSAAAQAMNIEQRASFAAQSLMTHALSSLGSSVDSMM